MESLSVPAALALFFGEHPAEGPWLVACSGGQDSVVLAHACKQYGVAFALAHVNYHLRGAESEEDEAFVRHLASDLGVPIHVASISLSAETGVQAAARAERYAFFEALRVEHGYAGTLLAHHADDQAETILFRMLRGTGLRGLRGMSVWDEDRKVGRPILDLPKPALAAYATNHHLVWREDRSNASDKYARNRIRHHLVPVLNRLMPSWQSGLFATAAQATEAWEQTEKRAENAFGSLSPWPDQFDLSIGQNVAELATTLEKLYPGLGYPHALQLAEAAVAPSQYSYKLETKIGVFSLESKTLYWSPAKKVVKGSAKEQAAPPPTISLGSTTAPASLEEIKVDAAKGIYYLSAQVAKPPYILRPPLTGDRMQPLGLSGTKLISDIRQEKGIPASQSRDIRLLVNQEGAILWCSLGVVAKAARCELGGEALRIIVN